MNLCSAYLASEYMRNANTSIELPIEKEHSTAHNNQTAKNRHTRRKRSQPPKANSLFLMVGPGGFEPPTSTVSR